MKPLKFEFQESKNDDMVRWYTEKKSTVSFLLIHSEKLQCNISIIQDEKQNFHRKFSKRLEHFTVNSPMSFCDLL